MTVQRSGGRPSIKWKHVDGPLLICSDGTAHFLTLFERFQLWLKVINIHELDRLYMDNDNADL